MSNPLFSICIPNYNYAHYVDQTIKSVLEQTCQDFEIIVADNASTDNSVEVIKGFQDDRIRLLRNEYNIGFSPNLDRATTDARGEYSILLSSDDLMQPTALEEYARLITMFDDSRDNLVLISAYNVIDGEGKLIEKHRSKFDNLLEYLEKNNQRNFIDDSETIEVYDGLFILKALLTTDLLPPGGFLTICYSNVQFRKVEGYNNIMSVLPDAHFSHKLCFQNPKLVYCNKELFDYRVHNVNHSQHGHQVDVKRLVDLFHISNSYSDQELASVQLSRKDLQETFIKLWCLQVPFTSLYSGRIARFYYYFIFGFASYPRIMFSQVRTYVIMFLSLFSPVFWMAGNLKRTLSRNAEIG